jgi:hypothetical protein
VKLFCPPPSFGGCVPSVCVCARVSAASPPPPALPLPPFSPTPTTPYPRSRDTLSGDGYRKTADAWLAALYRNKRDAMAALRGSLRAFHRWRIFFLVTSETWGHASGDWEVSWYRLRKV